MQLYFCHERSSLRKIKLSYIASAGNEPNNSYQFVDHDAERELDVSLSAIIVKRASGYGSSPELCMVEQYGVMNPLPVFFVKIVADDSTEALPYDFIGGVPEEFRRSLVPDANDPWRVEENDRLWRLFHENST